MPDSPTGLQENSDTFCLTRNSQTCLSFCLYLPFLFQGRSRQTERWHGDTDFRHRIKWNEELFCIDKWPNSQWTEIVWWYVQYIGLNNIFKVLRIPIMLVCVIPLLPKSCWNDQSNKIWQLYSASVFLERVQWKQQTSLQNQCWKDLLFVFIHMDWDSLQLFERQCENR